MTKDLKTKYAMQMQAAILSNHKAVGLNLEYLRKHHPSDIEKMFLGKIAQAAIDHTEELLKQINANNSNYDMTENINANGDIDILEKLDLSKNSEAEIMVTFDKYFKIDSRPKKLILLRIFLNINCIWWSLHEFENDVLIIRIPTEIYDLLAKSLKKIILEKLKLIIAIEKLE